MQSFRFRLQSLLDLRRRQAEAEEAALAGLIAGRARLEQRRRDLLRSDRDAREAVARSIEHSAIDLQTVGRFSTHVMQACVALADEMRQQDERIERQRDIVQKRQRDLELLEGLKQEGLASWTRAMELELEGLAADSHIAAWNRRKQTARR